MSRCSEVARRRLVRFAGFAVIALMLTLVFPLGKARAVPSFARQTGLPCTVCHTAFPELTPYGRAFKLSGYVSGAASKIPPLAAMVQGSFTHTGTSQAGGAAPGFGGNDNLALDAASVFYAGRIYGPVGAFVQGTYSGVDDNYFLDNTDLRFAKTTTLGGRGLIYGLTVNNNPTVQDVWNTTPVWGYPYASSSLAPTPAAATLIEGRLAQQVVGGGAYTMWNDLLYVELSGYHTLPKGMQESLGTDPTGENQIDGLAPYWRLALQHTWGKHYLSGGTFGLVANTFPGRDDSAGHDQFTDIGLDLQYQFFGEKHSITWLTTAIREEQLWRASEKLGLTDHRNDTLWSFKTGVSYLYEHTYGARLTYFLVNGDRDSGLYAPDSISGSQTGSPKSDGLIAEITWLPFNKHPWSVYPWLNIRLSVQYVAYFSFNGATRNYDGQGRNAWDNNTLYILGWMAF